VGLRRAVADPTAATIRSDRAFGRPADTSFSLSQKNEADAQASYRGAAEQVPDRAGVPPSVIKRADLGDKGSTYRAMVGPFGSADEASSFCGNLKTPADSGVVQRN